MEFKNHPNTAMRKCLNFRSTMTLLNILEYLLLLAKFERQIKNFSFSQIFFFFFKKKLSLIKVNLIDPQ